MKQGKELHDLLLAMKPAEVAHETCPLCDDADTGGTGSMEFTPEQQAAIAAAVQSQIDAAVAAATAPLIAERDALKAGSEEAAIQAKVDDAVAAVAAEKAELQSKLDAEVAARTAAEQTLADTTAYLAEVHAEAERAAEADKVKETRVAEVAAVIEFPAEHVAERAQGWAEMAPEAFTAELEGYKVLAEKHPALKPKKVVTPPPAAGGPAGRSALTAAETPAPAGKPGRARIGAAREVMALRGQGIDVRELAK